MLRTATLLESIEDLNLKILIEVLVSFRWKGPDQGTVEIIRTGNYWDQCQLSNRLGLFSLVLSLYCNERRYSYSEC